FLFDADFLEQLTRARFAHGDGVDQVQMIAHEPLRRRRFQRTGADGVNHYRYRLLARELDFAQINLGLRVEKDAAAAEDEEVKPLELRDDFVAREIAHRNHAGGARMPPARVFHVARENRDFDRQGLRELEDNALQYRFIAQVEPAVGTGNAD